MLHRRYKYRIFFIVSILLALGIAAGLILYALRQNIDLYYTPSQLFKMQMTDQISKNQSIRLGGLVKIGSFQRDMQGSRDQLKSTFSLTDQEGSVVKVIYQGVLPALFKEGQGIIVQGHLNDKRLFVATEVFAKHDEKYEPPLIKQIKK